MPMLHHWQLSFESLVDSVDKVLKWIDEDGTAKAGTTFCDAGCGVGSLAIPLAQRGGKVSASDISAAMAGEGAARAKAMGVKNVEFSTSDLESIEGNYHTVRWMATPTQLGRSHGLQLSLKPLHDISGDVHRCDDPLP